ncbi:MAG: sodium:calcium antiporter [Candidatus Promineifilaceae bacterium]
MWIDALIVVVCIVGLWLGGSWIVDAAARIARKVGMSELVIGLTIVAIGTSAPEFAVTVAAALNGQSDISVGNVVGSNIFNLGFILGGVALIAGIPTTPKLVWRDGMMLIATTLLLLFFLIDLHLASWEGIVLLIVLISYVSYLILKRDGGDSAEEMPDGDFQLLDVPMLIGGIALIVTSGHFLVESASEIARHFGLSEWVIGVTIVAAGTSAPELATSVMGVLRGRHGISIGNLIGSDLFNLLGVLGLAAIISPLTVDSSAMSSMILLCGLVMLVVFMLRTDWRLSRVEGGLLIAINLVRWIADFT